MWPSNKALLSSGVTPSNSGVSLEISTHSGHHLPPRRRSQLKVRTQSDIAETENRGNLSFVGSWFLIISLSFTLSLLVTHKAISMQRYRDFFQISFVV